MHELSIASGLVDKLLDFLDQNPDKKIVSVRVAIGELTHIEEEQLRFSYEAITAETPLEGSTMEIEKIEARRHLSALQISRASQVLGWRPLRHSGRHAGMSVVRQGRRSDRRPGVRHQIRPPAREHRCDNMNASASTALPRSGALQAAAFPSLIARHAPETGRPGERPSLRAVRPSPACPQS